MIITSKFPGSCRICGGAIAAGERVSWTKGVRGADHAGCTEEGKAIAEAAASSRATNAEIEIPVPEGLDYMPFQRAGIAFAMRVLGYNGSRENNATRDLSKNGESATGGEGESGARTRTGGAGEGERGDANDGVDPIVRRAGKRGDARGDGAAGGPAKAPGGTGEGQGATRGELSGGQRAGSGPDGSTGRGPTAAAGLRGRVSDPDERSRNGASGADQLQSGFRPSDEAGRDRAGRSMSPTDRAARAGSEENGGSPGAGLAGLSDSSPVARGVLIADEPGLGKTIQTAGVINADASIRNALVVGPKSLALNWIRELRRWLVRPFHISRIAQQPADEVIVVVSYEEAKKYQAALIGRWDLIVVDEAHWIKNSKAQRTKAVHAISKGARRRIALTGTPIVNRPIELFPLLQLVDPEEWDPAGRKRTEGGLMVDMPAGSGCGFFKFAKRYCGAAQGKWGWDFSGASNLPELQERLRTTCMVRRLKTDVLTDLPAKRRQVVELIPEGASLAVQAEAAAWRAHEEQIDEARAQVELAKAESDSAYDNAVERLQENIRVSFTEISILRHATAVAKIPHVIEHAKLALEDGDQKLVLFAHHHDVIDGIAVGLKEFGVVKLTGRDDVASRQSAVDRFQKDPSCRVFIGGIMAAGVGITLTAAAHVVFAELDFVPGNVTQAEDRCHRIGQTESVLVQHLVFDGSLDARMAQVLVAKQKIADASLDKLPDRTPAIPGEAPATSGKRAELDEIAKKLTTETIEQVHQALRRLAGMCDGASSIDGSGFSKIDVRIGHELAARPHLSPKQAALGWKLARKYRRQVGVIELAA